MRRRLIAAIVLLAGCASAGPPPGGPDDLLPPKVVRVTPDTNAVNVRDRVATFYFDEVINDRGTGPQDVSNYFLVSPSDGAPKVSWRRSRIEVRPRHGFRDNTAYTITLLPGLADLRSNSMKDGATLIFATGPTIPTLRITGTAFDWVGERTAARAYIEARTADSIVYLAQADSVGRFTIGPLGPGTYLVRAILDQNQNRALDRSEAWDSVRVNTPQSSPVELLAVLRDTLAAQIGSVSVADSVTLRLTFNRLLDPAQAFAAGSFRIVGADSVAIPVTAVRTPREDAVVAKALQEASQKIAADSVRRADSLAGKPLLPAVVAPAPAPVAGAAGRPAPAPPALPSRPPPYSALTLVLGKPLTPNTRYRASVTSVRALSGKSVASEVGFSTPKPPPPRAPSDTTAPAPRAIPAPRTGP